MSRRIAGVLLAMVALVTLVACGGAKKTSYASPGAAAGVQQLWYTIVNGSFVVPPRTFKPFEIVVGDGMARPWIEGTFTASGANNDIEVLLLDEQQYNNWQNRHDFRSAYASGRVTADKFRIELPNEPGKYFMIFSNRFSIFSNKGVVADLKLRYDRNR
jgi:hypothetical protein